ncbi:MAG: 16S rRNA processing protein RimM [Rhodospirillales bacterium]|nr:MAG: 16S rRNA processing protein RimM [Rhodospirillales bacterium]
MAEERLCVGVIVGAHGIRGDLRVKSFTARPEDLVAYGPLTDLSGARQFRLRILGSARGVLRVHMEGIEDRNAAEALAGIELYIARNRLPATETNEFYHADLIGLRAERPDGSFYGTVRAIHDFGAGAVIEIALAEGGVVVLPFTEAVVPVINLEDGRVVIELPADISADNAPGGDEG